MRVCAGARHYSSRGRPLLLRVGLGPREEDAGGDCAAGDSAALDTEGIRGEPRKVSTNRPCPPARRALPPNATSDAKKRLPVPGGAEPSASSPRACES